MTEETLQMAQDVVHVLEVGQIDRLDFAQVRVAGEALRSQVFNDRVRAGLLKVHKPLAGGFKAAQGRSSDSPQTSPGNFPSTVRRRFGL